ncbi:class I SAM-dependent methyltransferase [Psychrobacillus sp. NPDC058041]|uniref:class I SAM-dependent methyltransferase n=1 Tax=Psychrobacillus sp. NPDC058041 TaxID=3346310 RepID=UPI0036D902E4
MKENWVHPFYKKQFEYFHDSLDDLNDYKKEVALIHEQVGKPFKDVLEIGAGSGILASTLSLTNKDITTVELVSELVEYAKAHSNPSINILCDNFYSVRLSNQFDLVLYLDGFGVGTDKDQLLLLQRIHEWLKDDGYALIDIYEPNYWKNVKGQQMLVVGKSQIKREYGYDDNNCRMTDTLWQTDSPNETITQTLACYSTDEINSLCLQAGLQIIAFYPGGAMNFNTWRFEEVASLSNCLSYRIKVKKVKS